MTKFSTLRSQGGVVTIFVSMIMLLLITLLVITAYSLSMMNLQAAGNVQAREEGIAAANVAIDRVIDSDFWTIAAGGPPDEVDLNGDGVTDFLVNFTTPPPECVRATPAGTTSLASEKLEGMSVISAYNTVWELNAEATDVSTGTKVRVIQGVRVMLNNVITADKC